MKIAVIIAEFNPFHKGHEYLIQQAREQTDCTHVVVVQTGNFTQRAEPAIIEKHLRAQTAVLSGVDAVIEMPTIYATSNAEVFAKAGVQLANILPHAAYLVFGVEDNNLPILKQIAYVKITHHREFEKFIKEHLKLGLSYEAAQEAVIKKLLPQISPQLIGKILSGGNNILAIEYIRELFRLHSSIQPVPIARLKQQTSALTIRNAFYENAMFEECIPAPVLPLTLAALTKHPEPALFESATLFGALTKLDPQTTYNANAELANLFRSRRPVTYQQLSTTLPNRRYSVGRVKRVALHSTLGITQKDIDFLYKNSHLPYTNLLAIRADANELFNELCSIHDTPVILHGNRNRPMMNKYCLRLLQIDKTATGLYEIVCKQKFIQKPVYVVMPITEATTESPAEAPAELLTDAAPAPEPTN